MKSTLVLKSWHNKAYQRKIEILNNNKNLKFKKAKLIEQLDRIGLAGFSSNKTRESIIKYLIGDNQSLYGSILSFRKRWQRNDPAALHYSFLLYYSHETGRIERFLFNSPDYQEIRPYWLGKISDIVRYDNFNKINNIKCEDVDLDSIDDDILGDYQYSFESGFIRNYPLSYLDFNYLNNGTLNKQFYDIFTIELVRDYFLTFNSFHITDMQVINYYTNPVLDGPYNIGRGYINEEYLNRVVQNHLDKDHHMSRELLIKYYKKLFGIFSATKFREYNKYYYKDAYKNNNKLLINIPVNFNWKKTNYIFNGRGLECINIPLKKQPQSIKDLKAYINTNTVTSRADLINKIISFNYISHCKLMNKLTNNNYNPTMLIENITTPTFKRDNELSLSQNIVR